MRRRDFIVMLGAVTLPVAGSAEQSPVPLIGFLSARSPEESEKHTAAVLQGLREFGYVEGETAAIEYRWSRGQYDRLPALAQELVALHPRVIIAGSIQSARAAIAATTSIPIVFIAGGDPVDAGLVASMNRPGRNVTGVAFMTGELSGKRLEFLLQLAPDAQVIAFLTNPQGADIDVRGAEQAVRDRSRRFVLVGASTDAQVEHAFAELKEHGASALIVANDPFFDSRRDRIIALAAQHTIPAIYHIREFPAAGGLMSYGASLVSAYHQVGIQAGRVLKGANPADVAVTRPTQFELVINLKTAKALGLSVPPILFAQADETIE